MFEKTIMGVSAIAMPVMTHFMGIDYALEQLKKPPVIEDNPAAIVEYVELAKERISHKDFVFVPEFIDNYYQETMMKGLEELAKENREKVSPHTQPIKINQRGKELFNSHVDRYYDSLNYIPILGLTFSACIVGLGLTYFRDERNQNQ